VCIYRCKDTTKNQKHWQGGGEESTTTRFDFEKRNKKKYKGKQKKKNEWGKREIRGEKESASGTVNLLVPMGVRSNRTLQQNLDITDIGHERAKTSGSTLLVTTRFLFFSRHKTFFFFFWLKNEFVLPYLYNMYKRSNFIMKKKKWGGQKQHDSKRKRRQFLNFTQIWWGF
jgi:hypothetical protein